jgi:xanthine dehydrogenase YagT iron-sulfur-binding subunit
MNDDHDHKSCGCGRKMSRRGFLRTMGIGTVAVAASRQLVPAPARAQQELDPDQMAGITLIVNGRRRRLLVEPRWSLLFVLREKLGLTGTKVGCERGECGACTVLYDGVPRYACLTLAVEAEGHQITTLEGLMDGEQLGAVQQAFLENDAYQCGYCTPGQIMAAEGLLLANADPSEAEIRQAMSGNLCRCGSYRNIFKAVRHAAQLKLGKGGRP